MRTVIMFTVAMLITILSLFSLAEAKEWRFPVGLAYVSGFGDIVDRVEGNLGSVETVDYLPIGLSFQPYLQFGNGFGVGGGFGPIMWITGDADFFNMPVNLHARYAINVDGNVSPYVRTGISTNLASGDDVEGSSLGFFGVIGVEFLKSKMVVMGVEISYDTSEIEMEKTSFRGNSTEDIKPLGFMVSIFAIF